MALVLARNARVFALEALLRASLLDGGPAACGMETLRGPSAAVDHIRLSLASLPADRRLPAASPIRSRLSRASPLRSPQTRSSPGRLPCPPRCWPCSLDTTYTAVVNAARPHDPRRFFSTPAAAAAAAQIAPICKPSRAPPPVASHSLAPFSTLSLILSRDSYHIVPLLHSTQRLLQNLAAARSPNHHASPTRPAV